ncbi:MAG: type II toxin-antitoxin system VapC family toxin [Acidobacteriota bacterium]
MILDSSAVVAILLREPGHETLLEALSGVAEAAIGAPNLVEVGIVLAARTGTDSRALLSRFLAEAAIVTIPFTDAHWSTAIDAWLRFGKGRHAAALNFGDCLAFATARVAGRPLLCVGDDFAETDLETVP